VKLKFKKPRPSGGGLSPQEFCQTYLPANWCERDLQLYVQRILKSKYINLLAAPDEVGVPTPTTRRRIDIATWHSIYEVKCWLNYDNIYHAIAQTELYSRYGGKMLGIIPKQRVVIGVAPASHEDLRSARRLSDDFSKLRGIKVIFINEHPEWHSAKNQSVNILLVYVIIFLVLFILSFAIIAVVK
jgi:hypothetical protein